MGRGFGHGGNERHGGGTAADDDDALAGVVQSFGPGLRMNDATLKTGDAGKLRSEAG